MTTITTTTTTNNNNNNDYHKIFRAPKRTAVSFQPLDTPQRGVQWMGGAVDWGSSV